MYFFRGRHEEFKDFFSQEDSVAFCNDIYSVMEVLGHEYNPHRWRLLIDSSTVSLKVVLLHNGNTFPSVPSAHAINTKECYESKNLLLGKIKHDEFKWKLCGYLKLWHCYRNATRLHKILLFPVPLGQPGQEESLSK